MKSGVGRYNLRVYVKDFVEYNQEEHLFGLLKTVSDFSCPVTISFWDISDDLCDRFNNKVLSKYMKQYPSVLFEIYNSNNYFRFAWFDMINSTVCVKFDKYKFRYSYNDSNSFTLGFLSFSTLFNSVCKMSAPDEGHSNKNATNSTNTNNKNRNIRVKYVPTAKNN